MRPELVHGFWQTHMLCYIYYMVSGFIHTSCIHITCIIIDIYFDNFLKSSTTVRCWSLYILWTCCLQRVCYFCEGIDVWHMNLLFCYLYAMCSFTWMTYYTIYELIAWFAWTSIKYSLLCWWTKLQSFQTWCIFLVQHVSRTKIGSCAVLLPNVWSVFQTIISY